MQTIRLVDYASASTKGYRYLNWRTWASFLKRESKGILKAENSELCFVLDDFYKIGADGLVWLLLVVSELARSDNYVLIQLPQNHAQLIYMESIAFINRVQEFASFTNPFELENIDAYSHPHGLPISKITHLTLGRIRQDLYSYTHSNDVALEFGEPSIHVDFLWEYAEEYYKSVKELLDNIVEHSNKHINKGWGYTVMFISGKYINICIADGGVGLTGGLARKGISVQDDKDSIRKALLYGYDKYKGEVVEAEGIFQAIRFVRKIGGYIKLRTGKAEGSLRMDPVFRNEKKEEEREAVRTLIKKNLRLSDVSYYPGVQYSILLQREQQ